MDHNKLHLASAAISQEQLGGICSINTGLLVGHLEKAFSSGNTIRTRCLSDDYRNDDCYYSSEMMEVTPTIALDSGVEISLAIKNEEERIGSYTVYIHLPNRGLAIPLIRTWVSDVLGECNMCQFLAGDSIGLENTIVVRDDEQRIIPSFQSEQTPQWLVAHEGLRLLIELFNGDMSRNTENIRSVIKGFGIDKIVDGVLCEGEIDQDKAQLLLKYLLSDELGKLALERALTIPNVHQAVPCRYSISFISNDTNTTNKSRFRFLRKSEHPPKYPSSGSLSIEMSIFNHSTGRWSEKSTVPGYSVIIDDLGRLSLGASLCEQKPSLQEVINEMYEIVNTAGMNDLRERLLDERADKNLVAKWLAGLDSPEVWAMREKLLKRGADKDLVAKGLAGLDSPEAWAMREKLLKQGVKKDLVVQGLAGLDSPIASAMRRRLLDEGANKYYVAWGLAGSDSPEAWAMREELLRKGNIDNFIAEGLAGLDSPKAWAMREKLLDEGADKDFVAQGLAGLDSPKAWAMRERLLKRGANKNFVAEGLAGLDSPIAWAMRERLLHEGAGKYYVAQGLAGLDSYEAWAMREKLLKRGADKDWVAVGLAGLDSYEAWAMRERLLNQWS